MTFDPAPLRQGAARLARQNPEKVRYAIAGFSDREIAGLPFFSISGRSRISSRLEELGAPG
jgi:hypothetical protein